MHRMLKNTAGRTMLHPVTRQPIMPGQSYLEPEDSEHVELIELSNASLQVVTVADPEATQKAKARQNRKKSGEDE